MPLNIYVPKETIPGETRVGLVPASIKKLRSQGFQVVIEKGAGESSSYPDLEYKKNGARVSLSKADSKKADVIVKVRPPAPKGRSHEASTYKKGAFLLSFQELTKNRKNLKIYEKNDLNACAIEWMPRSSLAQSMDVLSSMATIAGYKAVLIAASSFQRFFPMLMTAAGTINPARVLILGAGVAGLQAIATARRMGARVEVFDIRPVVKEQVMSLGAKFIELDIPEQEDMQDKQGYGKELSKAAIAREMALIEKHLIKADICISTAQVFGKKAPVLILKKMVSKMKAGSVIVDLAVEQGGNCEISRAGKTIEYDRVKVLGPINIASEMPVDASRMYSKNMENLLLHLFPKARSGKDKLHINEEDEITRHILMTRNGRLVKKDF